MSSRQVRQRQHQRADRHRSLNGLSSPSLAPTTSFSSFTQPSPVYVCSLPNSAFQSKDHLFDKIFTCNSKEEVHSTLNENDILKASTASIFPLLTLILCAIEQESVGSDKFLNLARAIRDRCAINRALKLRLLISLDHASFPKYYLKTVRRDNSYSISTQRLSAQLHYYQNRMHTISNGGTVKDYNTSKSFCDYIAQMVFAPSQVKLWANTNGIFTTNGLIKAIENTPGVVDSSHAKLLLKKIIQYGLATNNFHTSNMNSYNNDNDNDNITNTIIDNRQTDIFNEHIDTFQNIKSQDLLSLNHNNDDMGNSYFTANDQFHSSLTSYIDDAQKVTMRTQQGKLLSAGSQKKNDLSENNIQSIQIVIPVDIIDLQSINFWCDMVYSKNFNEGVNYGIMNVVHPMKVSSIERDKEYSREDTKPTNEVINQLSKDYQDKILIEKIEIIKVFQSLSRPCMINCISIDQGIQFDTLKLENKEHENTIKPQILLKKGDNLMQDHCVLIMFQVFNYIWRHSSTYNSLYDSKPHCFSYEVIPTSIQQGFMEGLSNVTALSDIDWSKWYGKYAKERNGKTIENLILSAAGAFVGGYILGATDRHWGNMVVKDDCTLLHIDFSFILGDAPPIDAPRISIPPQMEKLFKSISIPNNSDRTLWDVFVEATVTAYLALRNEANVILNAADMLFTHAGFDPKKVNSFIAGKSALALDKSEHEAASYLKKKIKSSSRHFKTKVKRFVHDVVNPVWYNVVQNGPLPAEGVMKLINRYQSENESTQQLTKFQTIKKERSGEQNSRYNIDIDE